MEISNLKTLRSSFSVPLLIATQAHSVDSRGGESSFVDRPSLQLQDSPWKGGAASREGILNG
jgi:hypothetical protein